MYAVNQCMHATNWKRIRCQGFLRKAEEEEGVRRMEEVVIMTHILVLARLALIRIAYVIWRWRGSPK